MKKPHADWIAIDVYDTLRGPCIIVAVAMKPYRDWCMKNIVSGTWYNDLYGTKWYEFYFSKPVDATAFMLMSGAKKVR